MKYEHVIVGAGLYGAMYAYFAAQRHERCLVVEKDINVGGFCYTDEEEGIMVHKKGAHIFRTNKKEVWDFVNSIAEFVPFCNCPIAMTKRGVFNMPFNMNTFSKLWGCSSPEEVASLIEEKRLKIEHPRNLEEFVLSRVGEEVYELLVKEYTEKQWGVQCSDLPCSIISDIPIRLTYDNSYFKETYQGVPMLGYTHFIEELLQGSEVLLGVDYFDRKEEFDKIADHVVYTGPLDRYFDYKFGKLPYRSVRFEEKIFDCENVFGNAVVNYTSNEVPYTRAIEHRHFDRCCKSKKSIVSYEYPIWGGEPCYPIESEDNLVIARKYKEEAKKLKKVDFGGRLAEYRYYAMNDIIEQFV